MLSVSEKEVRSVLDYFLYFKYAPSFEEIYRFLPVKTTRTQFKKILIQVVEKHVVIASEAKQSHSFEIATSSSTPRNDIIPNYKLLTTDYYTIRGHSILFKERVNRTKETEKKLEKISHYISTLSMIPGIKLIGLSGSCAMGHATKTDDVDLFIISSHGRMWGTRFFALLLATIMGLRRRRNQTKAPGKVCLNMFFDERYVFVPYKKQNLYTAHEVLQMKPLVNKGQTYEKFLKVNEWVIKYFPNKSLSSIVIPVQAGYSPASRLGIYLNRFRVFARNDNAKRLLRSLWSLAMTVGNTLEFILKNIQLTIINRHKTTELITETQLWFFPHDFEKKLKKQKII